MQDEHVRSSENIVNHVQLHMFARAWVRLGVRLGSLEVRWGSLGFVLGSIGFVLTALWRHHGFARGLTLGTLSLVYVSGLTSEG